MKKNVFPIIIILLMFIFIVEVRADNKVLMHVDSPNISATKDGVLEIKGWIMSEYVDKKVNIYIDDILQEEPTRVERDDVLNAIKNYGTKEENNLPGYELNVNTTDLSIGTHSLKIEVVNSENKLLSVSEKYFELTPYKTAIYIDSPTTIEKKGDIIQIRGWTMSETPDKKIEVYLDNNLVTGVIQEEREDVHKAIFGYGTVEDNKLPGFYVEIDSSTLSVGQHSIEIKVVDTNTKEILSTISKEFALESYKTATFLDTPKLSVEKATDINISGWVMSECSDKRIEVYVDNILQSTPVLSKRDDVLNVVKGYGTKDENPTPGFSTIIDTTQLSSGKHQIEIKVIDNKNEEVLNTLKKEIEVEDYNGIVYLETPRISVEKTNTAIIEGWYLSNATNKRIEIYIDDILQATPVYYERDDVLKVIKGYGDETENPTPGFKLNFDTTLLKTGDHEIQIKIIDNNTNETITEASSTFVVENYETRGYIDSPIYHNEGTSLYIRGWIMSETANKKVRVTIDDILVEDFSYEERIDVIEAVNGYGTKEENPLPGFTSSIDVTNFTDGKHTVKLEVIDTITNEVIYQKNSEFTLEKYQGTIYLESPTGSNYNGDIEISGWEMSEYPNSYVKIFYNGTELSSEVTRHERDDVIAAVTGFGDKTINSAPGFTTTINTTSLPEGRGVLTVELYTSLNEKICTINREINVYNSVNFGIDVSRYQTNVNWPQVKAFGIDYAFVRVGFRGYGSGLIGGDQYFKSHVIGASTSGLDVGIYFFSQAINTHEAIEEANYSIDMMQSQGLTQYVNLPIVIDTEYSGAPNHSGRADNLTVQQRTDVVRAFANTVRQRGYEPMIYASKSFLYGNLDMSQLSDIDVWLAHYTAHPSENPDPFSNPTNYNGIYDYWQYTSKGYVNGINGYVDMNLGY